MLRAGKVPILMNMSITTGTTEMNYTIYNTGDIIFWKPNGDVAHVWTSDGLYCSEGTFVQSNFLTKAIVHCTRYAVIAIDRFLKA